MSLERQQEIRSILDKLCNNELNKHEAFINLYSVLLNKDPYEEAIKWIENEVRKHGTIKIERCTEYVDVENDGTLSAYPNHKISGFTVSSQHTDGEDYNILQLISTMKRLSTERK